MSDIRKWFVKAHPKDNAAKPAGDAPTSTEGPAPEKMQSDKPVNGGQESSVRRKTSKYFATDKQEPKDATEKETEELPGKRKAGKDSEPLKARPSRKLKIVEDDDDDDFVPHNSKKSSVDVTPNKKLKSSVDVTPNKKLKSSVDVTPNKKLKSVTGRGVALKTADADESDEDESKATESPLKPVGRGRGGRGASANPAGGRGRGVALKTADADESDEDESKATESPLKPVGRGRGGRGASANPAGGRGRGGGRGFMNFGERKDPPHKGEKEVPEGAPNCLANLVFVISGTLDSLEREEAEDLIKRHGGRVTGSVSKKTNYLLCDEDIGGRKSERAKELRTAFLTEDGLFDLIRASNRGKAAAQEDSKKSVDKIVASVPKKSPQKVETKKDSSNSSPATRVAHKLSSSGASPAKQKDQNAKHPSLTWTEKYKPKTPNDIIGNQSLVKQLHDWLSHWNEQFLDTGKKGKGKKQSDSNAKKAVLLNGTPGIGKTTSAKLVSQMLGFQAVEVNASDSRGKANAKIEKGIGGSNANSIKELVSNESLSLDMNRSKHQKTVLIMDEVDGMSAGDRGGVADLISSIKASKVPIICICNDRYSQKLKSLVNHCLLLTFRKPTKQQMAKRLSQVAKAEGLQVNEIALEELAERVNGDMRMALNQLQYMGLSMSVIKYDDVRERLLSSAKDEDISPFTAVDKLFSFNGGKLRMDERMNLSMSDPDLVPLLIQENYINFRPSAAGKDDHGIKRMNLIARAAESIGDGDIINVQIRRYRQWQLSQTGSLATSIIPAALLHGSREILEQGERNYNRFGGWLGKNSTMGKNYRLMDDLHVHFLASRESNSGRRNLRIEYLTLLQKRLTNPLKELPKDEAVQKVVEFMNTYSISQEDFDTIIELSKFKGHPTPMDGIAPAVKSALTKAYKEGSKLRMVRAADLVTIPGMKKAPKKRIAAMLEQSDEGPGEANGDALAESEEENSSDTEEGTADDQKLQNLQSLNSKGIKVEVDLKGTGSSSAKKTPAGRGRGGGAKAAEKKSGGRVAGAATKRKR